MGGTLKWAARFEPPPGPKTTAHELWTGPGVWHANISGASVTRLEAWGARHGVEPDMWPIYGDTEAESDIDTEEVAALSEQLRVLLCEIPPAQLQEEHWAQFIWDNILQHGRHFFVKAA